MDKTISVKISFGEARRYNRFIRRTSVFKAHDESNQAKVGDRVRIPRNCPMSKTKRWKLAEDRKGRLVDREVAGS